MPHTTCVKYNDHDRDHDNCVRSSLLPYLFFSSSWTCCWCDVIWIDRSSRSCDRLNNKNALSFPCEWRMYGMARSVLGLLVPWQPFNTNINILDSETKRPPGPPLARWSVGENSTSQKHKHPNTFTPSDSPSEIFIAIFFWHATLPLSHTHSHIFLCSPGVFHLSSIKNQIVSPRENALYTQRGIKTFRGGWCIISRGISWHVSLCSVCIHWLDFFTDHNITVMSM